MPRRVAHPEMQERVHQREIQRHVLGRQDPRTVGLHGEIGGPDQARVDEEWTSSDRLHRLRGLPKLQVGCLQTRQGK